MTEKGRDYMTDYGWKLWMNSILVLWIRVKPTLLMNLNVFWSHGDFKMDKILTSLDFMFWSYLNSFVFLPKMKLSLSSSLSGYNLLPVQLHTILSLHYSSLITSPGHSISYPPHQWKLSLYPSGLSWSNLGLSVSFVVLFYLCALSFASYIWVIIPCLYQFFRRCCVYFLAIWLTSG